MQNERDFIMQKVFLACKHQDEEVMENGLNCLREIAVQEYEFVEFYFLEICQITEAATKSTSSKVGAQAFEFWSTFAEEEIERRSKNKNFKNYIEPARESLILMIL